MKKDLMSNMAVGEEKKINLPFRSFYFIKRIDGEFFKVKLYNKNGEVLEKYKIPTEKIDEVFKLY